MDTEVKKWLDALPLPVRRLVVVLRAIVRRAAPQAEESVLWGGLSYHRPEVGGRIKGAVCMIGAKTGQVRLEFVHGIRLTDPSGLLQGRSLSKRFVPVATIAAARRAPLQELVRAASALDPSTWTEAVRIEDGPARRDGGARSRRRERST